jgi:hypothetical protein
VWKKSCYVGTYLQTRICFTCDCTNSYCTVLKQFLLPIYVNTHFIKKLSPIINFSKCSFNLENVILPSNTFWPVFSKDQLNQSVNNNTKMFLTISMVLYPSSICNWTFYLVYYKRVIFGVETSESFSFDHC